LHALHRSNPELRQLIERSLGEASGYNIVTSRAEFMHAAQEIGIRAPQTKKIESANDLREWFSAPGASGVLKLDRTCGGKGVEIVRSLAEAEKALSRMRKPSTFMTALGRWVLVHDALSLWKWKSRDQPTVTLQRFIAGQPANTMLACREGKVLAMVTVEVLFAQSTTGTALAVRLIESDEIRTAAERIAARLQLSGFHGLDFVLEEETGNAHLIELNPRCTQLGHLRIAPQGDLAGVLCRSFSGATLPDNTEFLIQETIAFFPEAVMSHPKCPYLRTAYVDAPWEHPQLVREMTRRDWRDRGTLARLYRAIRPQKRVAVNFEPIPFGGAAIRESAGAPEGWPDWLKKLANS
jgi:carbamoylphosphate synthase large subunit